MADYTKKEALRTGDSLATENSQTYADGKATYQSGVKTYNTGYGYYDLGKRVFEGVTAGEEYGGYWSGSALSDPGLVELKKQLDDANAAGESTRAKREADYRTRVAAFSALVSFAGPWFGVFVYFMAEAFLWIGKTFWSGSDGNSQKDREDAVAAVGALWERWRMSPPAFTGDVMTARGYANTVKIIIDRLDASDAVPWREAWVKVVDNAMSMIEGKKSDLLRDAALSGWIPTSVDKFVLGLAIVPNNFSTSPVNNVPWGGTYSMGKDKYGNDHAPATVASYEYARKVSDPQAAGIGMMVAAYTGKRWEPLIEEAVKANHASMNSYGAYFEAQFLRIRDIFRKTMKASEAVPERNAVVVLNRGALDLIKGPDSTAATRGSSIVLPAAAGIVAGLAFGGPIGIAVGIGALVVSKLLGGGEKK